MAELLHVTLRLTLFLLVIGCTKAKRFSIMAPNVFHIGVEEKVSVTLYDANQPVTVKLYLQDYPHRQKTFSEVQVTLPPQKGSSSFLAVKVEPEDLPDINAVDKQYVYLVAKSDDGHFQFHKEARILLSYKNGMVFIQTDKPIYTPRQKVRIRVFPLQFDMKPSAKKITLVVLNPQGIRVQQWKDLDTSTGIISQELPLSDFIILGNWTITAIYGHQNIHNTSVQFEIREYVLPKFSVKLEVPPYILNTDTDIKVLLTARYTYGKPVVGAANVYLSIAGLNGQVVPIATHQVLLDRKGAATVEEKVNFIKEIAADYWFPEKSRLLVQADVIERATGNKETAVDKSCQFTSSPYVVEIKDTLDYFKPGLPFAVKVVVTHPNKEPAKSVPVIISATGIGANDKKELINSKDTTNEDGETEFRVDACTDCQTITIEVKTNKSKTQAAVANFMMKAFDAENGPLIMMRQLLPGTLMIGEKPTVIETYRSGDNGAAIISFVVVSRGQILSHDTTEVLGGGFKSITKSWSFRVSPEMSPSARLIAYYIDSNERVVADSILLKIEDKLPTKVDFPDAVKEGVELNEIEKFPGDNYRIQIKAPQGTRLGLLCVDQSVYLLRNENRLTKERIFKTAEELDLGCGAGGGKNSRDIFKKAGVVIMTNDFVSDGRNDYGCNEDGSRRKRSSAVDSDENICCEWGKKAGGNVTCAKLSMDGNRHLPETCRKAFWECCKEKYGANDTALLGRSVVDPSEMKRDEQFLDRGDFQERTDFPEAWIWNEVVANEAGTAEMHATVPDTITTWVMQAVAINNKTGLGLATPLRIVSKKEFFVSLSLPYSVKRGEQISLLATVFNYMTEEIRAKIYLTGEKDFCSIAADNKLALIGRLDIPPNDAKSVAVPIVPKTVGEIEIKVSAILQINRGGNVYMNVDGDAVRRKLLVLPEGVEHRTSQSFILDPKGILNDDSKNGDNKPTVAPLNIQRQSNTVEFKIPFKKAIPGSTGAIVYVTGNLLGPVVNTTIEGGLEKFFRQPTGCGEQTMIRLAPNVYVLEYLTTTKQLSGANEENAYRFIQSGYQRELNYRRNDKSFSAWGNSRPGSTWLTAFVMKVFCKAQQFSGVAIDENVVCESVSWLIQNQRVDGALPEVHAVIHREMVGGVYNSEGDVAMTAFVLSALAECKCEGVNSQASILRATDYLEKQYKNLNKPYSMALTAYALSLVDSREKVNANDRLVQRALYDDVKKSRHWNAGGNALNVETAGYALLTQVILGRTGYAGPIVTYITSQRQGGVGFVSTQDTVVALQALALYSEKTAGNALDLRVKVWTESGGVDVAHHITTENALLRREITIPTGALIGKLYVDTEGSGVGLLEVETRYNLPSSRGEICKFDLKTTVKEIKEDKREDPFGPVQDDAEEKERQEEEEKRNKKKKGGRKKGGKKGKGCKRIKDKVKKRQCKNRANNKGNVKKDKKPSQKYQPVKNINLKVCTRYKEAGNTGMSIMDIGILTGFKPNKKSLNELNTTLPELDRIEESDRSLVAYLSEIPSNRELCVDVQFDREYYVGAVQAVPVNVYDYYEPDQSCSVFYGPDKFSPLKVGVCDVGSSSCKCTQDECAQQDPPIDNIVKLTNKACSSYQYVIKGKLLWVDEEKSMLNYVVEVVQIIRRGNKEMKQNKDGKILIELTKRATCQSPHLEVDKEYLIMGRDDGGKYELDKTSFVRRWPQDASDNDKITLDTFAKRFKC